MRGQEVQIDYWPSFTDLMTGIVFLFILLISVYFVQGVRNSRIQEQLVKEIKKEQVIEVFETKALIAEELSLFPAGVKEGTQIVKRNTDNTISIIGDIVFPSGEFRSSAIRPEAQVALTELANRFEKILQNPKYAPYIHMILIEGHTDDVPHKSSDGLQNHNWNLASDRALSIAHYMFKANPALAQDEYAKYFAVGGYAQYRPAVEYKDLDEVEIKKAREQNRRISFQIILKEEALKTQIMEYIQITK